MKYFAQMLAIDLAGKITEACGSDAHLPLDGRLTLLNMRLHSKKYMRDMKNLHGYVGFKIYRGDLHSATLIYTHVGQSELSLRWAK